MPLMLPLLRGLLLFLNVYETFKTLKPPRRNPRGGQPSIRAVSQRKRDMKGCMTVWLLWSCCTVFERNCDGVLGMIVPFYGEFKSLVYLFQILTRARGAEPIYLHVMRPVIRPYVATLDWSLDVAYNVGDFIVLVLWLPMQLLLDWRNPKGDTPTAGSSTTVTAAVTVVKTDSSANAAAAASAASCTAEATATANTGVGTRTRRQAYERIAAVNRPSAIPTVRSAPAAARRSSAESQRKYEIWHPPSTASNTRDTQARPTSGRRISSDPSDPARRSFPRTPPEVHPQTEVPMSDIAIASSVTSVSERVVTNGNGEVVAHVEEWRAYLPFPSAYPPTPLKVTSSMSAGLGVIVSQGLEPVSEGQVDDAVGNSSGSLRATEGTRASSTLSLPTRRRRANGIDDVHSSLDDNGDEQDFGQSLLRRRESLSDEDSNSRGGTSDEKHFKQQWGLQVDDDEGQMDVYMSDGDKTMVASVASLDQEFKTVPSSESVSQDEVPRKGTMDPMRRQRSNVLHTAKRSALGSASARNVSKVALASRAGRTVSQSTAVSSISSSNSLDTPISRAASAVTLATAPSSSSGSGSIRSGLSDGSTVAGVKRPRPTTIGRAAGRKESSSLAVGDRSHVGGRTISHASSQRSRKPPRAHAEGVAKSGLVNEDSTASETTVRSSSGDREIIDVDALEDVSPTVPTGTGTVPKVKRRRVGARPGQSDMPPPPLPNSKRGPWLGRP